MTLLLGYPDICRWIVEYTFLGSGVELRMELGVPSVYGVEVHLCVIIETSCHFASGYRDTIHRLVILPIYCIYSMGVTLVNNIMLD